MKIDEANEIKFHGIIYDDEYLQKDGNGYCDEKCPHFRYTEQDDHHSGAECSIDSKFLNPNIRTRELFYHDGFLAKCWYQD